MNKFKNKYRTTTARAQWWNYGWNGAYFVTICTAGREHYLGEIFENKIILSGNGVIADVLWHDIPSRAPYIELGEFTIMPNHIHGILILDRPGMNDNNAIEALDPVEALHATPLQHTEPDRKNKRMSEISPNAGSISTIIRSYKSGVTKHANRLGFENGWQPRFHEHIIRNHGEFERISNYIRNNPANWKDDKFYRL